MSEQMKLPKKYAGATAGPWGVDDFVIPEHTGTKRMIRSENRHWALASVNEVRGCSNPAKDISREEAEANATMIADSYRLAAAVVELREALEAILDSGSILTAERIAQAALESTKEFQA